MSANVLSDHFTIKMKSIYAKNVCILISSTAAITRWKEEKKSKRPWWPWLSFHRSKVLVDKTCFGCSELEMEKTGWRNVRWGIFTHQHGVDEGQTQLVKVKVFLRCGKFAITLIMVCWSAAIGTEGSENSRSHTPTGFGVLVWGHVCVYVDVCMWMCVCG